MKSPVLRAPLKFLLFIVSTLRSQQCGFLIYRLRNAGKRKMYWVTALLLLATAEFAQPQCPTREEILASTYSTDLAKITDFGLDLYKRLSPPNARQNFFFSPYSIWNALTLAYFGSRGSTRTELEAALRHTDKASTLKLWKELELFYMRRQSNNTLYTFNTANRAYVHKTLPLRTCMEDLLSSELRLTDFDDPSQSSQEVNAFVNRVTRGRIPTIVTEADLRGVVMVIVNAAFFKGTWKTQFDPANTRQEDFFLSQTQSAPLAMMTQMGNFRFGQSDRLGARLLELPYAGDDISMILLLPSNRLPFGQRFANMVNNLNSATLREALHPNNMVSSLVEVKLPKFKFEMTLKDELRSALQTIGIRHLFDELRADLMEFTPVEGLYVRDVIHKAFVEVNEEGTEAAAATALLIPVRSFRQHQEFHCNQPFIFLIYDRKTNNILFMGSIQDPR